MKLKEYLEMSGLSRVSLARLMKIPPPNITHWIKGKHKPSAYHLCILKKVTHGKVTEEDFLE